MTTISPEAVITADTVFESLERAVEAYGADFVDPNTPLNCQYEYQQDGVSKHCIVGWVLKDLGLPLPADNLSIVTLWEDGKYRELTHEAVELLSSVQHLQDGGEPWGRIVEDQRFLFVNQSLEQLAEDELAVLPEESVEEQEGWL